MSTSPAVWGEARAAPLEADAAAGLERRPAPPVISGPFEVTRFPPDYANTVLHPTLSVLGPRIYVMHTVDLLDTRNEHRLALSASGGFAWTAPSPDIQDAPDNRAGRLSPLVPLRDGVGYLWTVYDATIYNDEIRFTPLDPLGEPLGPSVRVGDFGPTREFGSRLTTGADLVAAGDILIGAWTDRYPAKDLWVHRAARSFDGGRTWSHPNETLISTHDFGAEQSVRLAVSPNDWVFASATLRDSTLIFRSRPAEESWEQVSSPTHADWTYSNQHDIAIAPDGTIGLLTVGYQGGPFAVLFWESHDDGLSWSAPLVISSGPGSHYDPHLAADRLGTFHAAWILSCGCGPSLDALYAMRRHGEPWTEPARANSPPGTVWPTVPTSVSIVADDDGYATIAWAHDDATGNPLAVYAATTRPGPVVSVPDVPHAFSFTVSPNPSRGAVTLRASAADLRDATIQLFDPSGRLVQSWSPSSLDASVNWDGRLASGREAAGGVYFWRIEQDGPEGRTIQRVRSVRLE